MKKIIIILGIIALAAGGCKVNLTKNKDAMTMDKLDFELLEEKAQKHTVAGQNYFEYDWTFTENGTETRVYGNKKDGFVMTQIPPNPAFFTIYKTYYPNGFLKYKGNYFGHKTSMIGEWEYYDEHGKLTYVIDEDEKFGKFGYNEVLLFLHQQGNINIETGENREKFTLTYNVEKKQWGVDVMNVRYQGTRYLIDGETGEVIEKKEYQGGIQ